MVTVKEMDLDFSNGWAWSGWLRIDGGCTTGDGCTGGEAAGDWESQTANDYIFDIDTDDAALQLYFRNGHEKFHLVIDPYASEDADHIGLPAAQATWHHLVIQSDGSTTEFWQDGDNSAMGQMSATYGSTLDYPVVFGASGGEWAGSAPCGCLFDDFAIWMSDTGDYPLSQANIDALQVDGTTSDSITPSGTNAELVVYYDFEQIPDADGATFEITNQADLVTVAQATVAGVELDGTFYNLSLIHI